MRAALAGAVVALGLAVAATTSGCFHPDKPACAFSCAVAPFTCPTGFVCGLDELCHDPASSGVCGIQLIDAEAPEGGDAGAGDASAGDAGAGDGTGER